MLSKKPEDSKVKFPSPVSTRSIIDVSGGGYFVTFNKEWVDQYSIAKGDGLMVWNEEGSDKIYVEPYDASTFSELQDKEESGELELLWRKEVKEFGGSFGVFLRKSELEEDLGVEEASKMIQTSNHTMIMEPYSRERAKLLQEKWREFMMEGEG